MSLMRETGSKIVSPNPAFFSPLLFPVSFTFLLNAKISFLSRCGCLFLKFPWGCGCTLHLQKSLLLKGAAAPVLAFQRFPSRPRMVPLHPITFQKIMSFSPFPPLPSSPLKTSPLHHRICYLFLHSLTFQKPAFPIPFPCTFRIFPFFRPSPHSVHVHAESFLFPFHLPKPLW